MTGSRSSGTTAETGASNGARSSRLVTHLAILDAVPIGEALARADARFAQAWPHWFFFGLPDKPERAILADPDAWYQNDPVAMGIENYEDYRRAIHDPATVHAMMEDYRAGLGVDRMADDADRAAGRKVGVPVLVLWAADDDLGDLYGDPLEIWRAWAKDLRGHEVPSGHHLAEEIPELLAAELRSFLGDPRHGTGHAAERAASLMGSDRDDRPRGGERMANFSGSGTKDDPWVLKTPPGTSEYQMYRDDAADPPAIVCQVGGTRLLYDARAIDDLHRMLKEQGDWVPLGGADEQKPAPEGSVEAWGRSADNPLGGWYGLKKGLRGRFGVYMPPLMEALGLAEVTHDPKNNRMRAI